MAAIAPSAPAAKHSSPYYRKSGLLYFIGAGSPPEAVKIGVATNQRLLGRLRAVHSTNHRDPVLLGVVPFTIGAMPMLEAERYERELHHYFGAIQLRKAGTIGAEWFAATPELLEFIATVADPLASIETFPDAEEIAKMYCVQVRHI